MIETFQMWTVMYLIGYAMVTVVGGLDMGGGCRIYENNTCITRIIVPFCGLHC